MVMGEKRDIKVNVTSAAKPSKFAPEPKCKITVQNPKGRNFEPKVDKEPYGFSTFFTSNEAGPHIFKIEYNGKEIPDSPITCEVEKLERRKVEVKGLEKREFVSSYCLSSLLVIYLAWFLFSINIHIFIFVFTLLYVVA